MFSPAVRGNPNCCDGGFKCYKRDWEYGACLPSCRPGIHWEDPPQFRRPWSCEEVNPWQPPTPSPPPPGRLGNHGKPMDGGWWKIVLQLVENIYIYRSVRIAMISMILKMMTVMILMIIIDYHWDSEVYEIWELKKRRAWQKRLRTVHLERWWGSLQQSPRAAGAPLRTATIANGPKIAVRAASRVMRRTIGGLGFGDEPWVSENGVGYTGKKTSKWHFFLGNWCSNIGFMGQTLWGGLAQPWRGTRPACQVALRASTPTTLLSFELLGPAVCWAVGAATRHHHHRHHLPQLPVRHLGDHAHQVGASIACKIQLAAIRLTLALKRVEATELVWTFACQAFIGPSRPRSEPGGRAGGWEHLPHPHHPHHHHPRHPRHPHHHLRLQRPHPRQNALQALLPQVEAVWTNPPVATPIIDASWRTTSMLSVWPTAHQVSIGMIHRSSGPDGLACLWVVQPQHPRPQLHPHLHHLHHQAIMGIMGSLGDGKECVWDQR